MIFSIMVLPNEILFIGDSITWGQLGDEPNSEKVYSQNAYSRLIQKLYPSKSIINISVPGTSSFDWKQGTKLFAKAQSKLPAKQVHILLGTNDSVGFFRDTPTSKLHYKNNIESLIQGILKFSPKSQIIISIPPYRPSPNDFHANLRIKRYAAIIQQIVSQHPQTRLGLDLRKIIRTSDYNDFDIHPTAKSHQRICELMIELLF